MAKKSPDWSLIEKEYVTSDIGYRKLAEKYDVSFTTLSTRAKAGEWPRKRIQHKDKVNTEAIKKIESARVDYECEKLRLIDETEYALLKWVCNYALSMNEGTKPSDAKHISDIILAHKPQAEMANDDSYGLIVIPERGGDLQ